MTDLRTRSRRPVLRLTISRIRGIVIAKNTTKILKRRILSRMKSRKKSTKSNHKAEGLDEHLIYCFPSDGSGVECVSISGDTAIADASSKWPETYPKYYIMSDETASGSTVETHERASEIKITQYKIEQKDVQKRTRKKARQGNIDTKTDKPTRIKVTDKEANTLTDRNTDSLPHRNKKLNHRKPTFLPREVDKDLLSEPFSGALNCPLGAPVLLNSDMMSGMYFRFFCLFFLSSLIRITDNSQLVTHSLIQITLLQLHMIFHNGLQITPWYSPELQPYLPSHIVGIDMLLTYSLKLHGMSLRY